MRPTAFVTYAHDSEKHKADVPALPTPLQESGIETELDHWATDKRRDWSTWAIEGMTTADHVVVVVSPDYKAPGDGLGSAAVNRGVHSVAAVLRDRLHRVITGRPLLVRPPRGPVRTLPPESRGDHEVTPLIEPLAVSWRSDLSGPTQMPTLEVHLIPAGSADRLQVRRLRPLADQLADHGRKHGLFDAAERLVVDSSDQSAQALAANTYRKASGLSVLRTGQRSAWSALPERRLGRVVLTPDQILERLADLITALLTLDLPTPDRCALAVRLEPVGAAIIGTRAELTARSSRVHSTYPPHLHIEPEESYTVEHLRRTVTDVADELAARLLAAFEREVG